MSPADSAPRQGQGAPSATGEALAAEAPAQAPEPTAGASAAEQNAGYFPLHVHAAWDETPTLRGLRLRGPAELLQQYRTPGQYLELVHADAGSGFFALAAAPREAQGVAAAPLSELELLIRHGPGLAGVLAALQPAERAHETYDAPPPATPPAAAAPASPVLMLRTPGVRGRGFAFSQLSGRDLLLVAAGSGIAPLRAVLQLLRSQRQQFGRVALYYGERTESDLAYRHELEGLRDAGVDVEPVLSRPPIGWTGGSGYVQHHLRLRPPPWLGENTVALLCGQSAMVSEVTALLRQHAVPLSQILMNY
mgnify:CR=1 FL=1